jgi:DNA-binding beta-propeller fold protein YncE
MVFLALTNILGGSGAFGGSDSPFSGIASAISSFAEAKFNRDVLGVGKSQTKIISSPFAAPTNLTHNYGENIPLLLGKVRVSGHIIWYGNARVRNVYTSIGSKFSTSDNANKLQRRTEKADLAIAFGRIISIDEAHLPTDAHAYDAKFYNGAVALEKLWLKNELLYDTNSTLNAKVNNPAITVEAFYRGTEEQLPDPYIESIEGVGNVPAFRGLCYVVLRDVNLTELGSKTPNISATLLVDTQKYKTGGNASAITISDDKAYILGSLDRNITAVDTISGKHNNSYALNSENSLKSYPWGIISTNNNYLWVISRGDATLQKVSKISNQVLNNIAVPSYPEQIIVLQGDKIAITFPIHNLIQIYSNDSNALLQEINVEHNPWHICQSDDGHLWVTTQTAVIRLDNDYNVVAEIAVGSFPYGIMQNMKTKDIWVAISLDDVLKVISIKTNAIIKERNTGTNPTHITAHANGAMYVSTFHGNQVKIYSSSYNELQSYNTVAFPTHSAIDQLGKSWVMQNNYNFAVSF